MACSVSGTKIRMTRGDTVKILVHIMTNYEEPYELQNGDQVRFFCKKYLSDRNYIFVKDVPIDSRLLTIDPKDTENLGYGVYYYDMKLISPNGNIDTFIDNAILELIA